MSLKHLLRLFDLHASGQLDDHALSTRLHLFDGKGILPPSDGAHDAANPQPTYHAAGANDEAAALPRGRHADVEDIDHVLAAPAPAPADAIAAAAEQLEIIIDSDSDSSEVAGGGGHGGGVGAAGAADVGGDPNAPLHVNRDVRDAPECYQMQITADLSPAFPPASPDGRFAPSGFQLALLEHVSWVRRQVGHSTGLLVMATALGKTVFCILDIQRQFVTDYSGHDDSRPEGVHKSTPGVQTIEGNRGGLIARNALLSPRRTGPRCSQEMLGSRQSSGGGDKRQKLWVVKKGCEDRRGRAAGADVNQEEEDAAATGKETEAASEHVGVGGDGDVQQGESVGTGGGRYEEKWEREIGVLSALGFPVSSCVLALETNAGCLSSAAHWLLQLQRGAVFEKQMELAAPASEARADQEQGVVAAASMCETMNAGREHKEEEKQLQGHARSERTGQKTRRVLLFMVHTRAIRDSAFDKFRRHFKGQGFGQQCFVNVTQDSTRKHNNQTLPAEMFRHAHFIFCLFQSFEKLPEQVGGARSGC